ncbi:MAG: PSD1 and planctomycete cytochrome C domain-containing protein [Planctomycetota bacterium]|nr:PSD1 and planctomycete cytochrome C domain-containing protein [Planctomycetota bacterium]
MRNLAISILWLGLSATAVAAAGPGLTFEQDVRGIFKAHCFECHGETDKVEGGLDLRLKRFLVAGGESGAAIVVGKPGSSTLIQRVAAGEMPPGKDSKKLTPQQIDVIRRWIAAGAKTARPEPKTLGRGFQFTPLDLEFWAFQPIQQPKPPRVQQALEIRNPLDRFVQARLEAAGHTLAPAAKKLTLLRRATFDLLGMPPTLVQQQRFLDDTAPGAWERLIERLLANPHYGERWGRHWLDAAGYADSEGVTNTDPQRKWAWRFRDWVIDAHNANQPWNRFLLEQLAGDELVSPPYKNLSPEQVRLLTATGFLRTAPDGTAGANNTANRNQVIAETLNVVSTSILGLTVGCAQCHNHRYDPIPQVDYYRLRAIFEPALDVARWKKPASRTVSLYTDANKAQAAKIEGEAKKIDAERTKKQDVYIQQTFDKEVAKLPEAIRPKAREARKTDAKKRNPEQVQLLKKFPSLNVSAGSLYLYDSKAAADLKKIAKRATDLRATKPAQSFIRVLTEDSGKVPVTKVFFRGDITQPRQDVAPSDLSILAATTTVPVGIPANDKAITSTGRRLAWAKKLTDGKHPLVARVIVNRTWMHHFGHGLAATPGDFGALGIRPTHPLLLDWLASEFTRDGWDLKKLHRLLMTSATYRQPATASPALHAADPDNRLLGRMSLRRLDAESLRDAVLATSGSLVTTRNGPPVPVMADRVGQWVIGKENLNAGRPGAVVDMTGAQFRRSVWVEVRRSRPRAVLESFDRPAMEPNCTQRVSTTVSSQSLLMMNSDFIVAQSVRFARRLESEAGNDTAAQVRLAWRLAYGIQPPGDAVLAATQFLEAQTGLFIAQAAAADKNKGDAAADKARRDQATGQALGVFCQSLLASNQFLYID